MNTPRFLPALLTLLGSSATLLVSSVASAGLTCTTNAACPQGFTCQVVATSGGCPVQTCPAGATCPPPPECAAPAEIRECVPGPCTTNADCASGMVCFEYTLNDCAVSTQPACDPNTKCPPVPDAVPCTPTTTRTCVPTYALPCTLDVNCGAGFTCVHDQICSGGVGTGVETPGMTGGASAGGAAGTPAPNPAPSGTGSGDVPPAPQTCTNLPTAHCEAQQVPCTTDASCPSQWTCVPSYTGGGTACSGGGSAFGPDAGAVPPDPSCVSTPPTPGPSYCMPPYYGLGYRSADQGTLGLPETGKGTSTPGSTNGAAGGAPTNPPAANAAGGSSGTANGAAPQSNDSGGCQVGFGHTDQTGTALLGLLGFLGLARRRRPRAA